MTKEPSRGTTSFDQLQATLEAALAIARQLAGDRLLGRLVSVFTHMPTADRPVIIDVLEREVTGRLLSRSTEKAVGQTSHPNPNARLYIRTHESQIDRRALGRDEMMIADIRAMRIAHLIRHVPELYANWKDAMREAMDHVDEDTRQDVEHLLHDVLDCVAQARDAAREPQPELGGNPPDADEGTQGS
ncbi:MAG: hypothetical protein L0206_11310 [Actinobacteria bacterium]|nr:hypothetical protein [Actinomycetota bacterium]